jgi:hypothetical protein
MYNVLTKPLQWNTRANIRAQDQKRIETSVPAANIRNYVEGKNKMCRKIKMMANGKSNIKYERVPNEMAVTCGTNVV